MHGLFDIHGTVASHFLLDTIHGKGSIINEREKKWGDDRELLQLDLHQLIWGSFIPRVLSSFCRKAKTLFFTVFWVFGGGVLTRKTQILKQ